MARRRGRPPSVARGQLVETDETMKNKAKKPKSVADPSRAGQQVSGQKPRTKVATTTRAAGIKARHSVVLTRAARKRAGIPPPTPLSRGAPKRPQSKAACSQDNSSSSSSSSSDEDETAKPLWVQCDYRNCQKWRKLPPGTKVDLEENWYCFMHPDPTYQSCGTPEEKCEKSRKRAFTFSKLTAGQLVWAVLQGFPPWPAIVSPDPWNDGDYISEDRIGCIYHVEFLGKMRTHSWVPEEQIEPYHCRSLCSLNTIRKSKQLDHALSEADHYATLTDHDRLDKLEYTENYMKVDGKKSALLGSTRQPPQAEKSNKDGATSNRRRRRLSISDTTPTQDKQQPLNDMSNLTTVKQEFSRKGAKLCNVSAKETHKDLFDTLGIAFCEDNRMNRFANTLVKEIQTQVMAALSKHTGMSVSAATMTQLTNASLQQSSSELAVTSRNATATANDNQISTSKLPRESPTARLTQTSLALSPNNQVKLVTRRQRKKTKSRHLEGTKENTRRKRRSPLQLVGATAGKKPKAGKSPDLVSPSIRDYFKTTDDGLCRAEVSGRERAAEERSAPFKDQEVPIGGRFTFHREVETDLRNSAFQSLEIEAESELQEIQNMLSMFDDIPTYDDETVGTNCMSLYTQERVCDHQPPKQLSASDNGPQLSGKPPLGQLPTSDTSKSLSSLSNKVIEDSDDADIESVLQEMKSIEDLLQDLSQAQVVPYSQ